MSAGAVMDLPTAVARAEALADSIDVAIITEDALPSDDVNAVLAPTSETSDMLIIRGDLDDNTRAAVVIFACALTTGLRDGLLDPHTVICRDDNPSHGEYVVIGSKRLPGPDKAGVGRLAWFMGQHMGVVGSANFEVLRNDPTD